MESNHEADQPESDENTATDSSGKQEFPPLYTSDLNCVIKVEKKYLEARREHPAYGGALPKSCDGNICGMCISGGGVRSSTFALGVLQALIGKDKAKRIDYLSTVSGGGYIGSCLTSLLTWLPSDDEPTPTDNEPPSMRPDRSPFVGLRQDEDYKSSDETKLSVRHQLHHLRTHGEFLTPHRNGLFSIDIKRAVGSVVTGIVHHFVLFALLLFTVAALTHAFLTLTVDRNLIFVKATSTEAAAAPNQVTSSVERIADAAGPETLKVSVARIAAKPETLVGILMAWWNSNVGPRVQAQKQGLEKDRGLFERAALAGALFAAVAVIVAWVFGGWLERQEDTKADTRAGWTFAEHAESRASLYFGLGLIALTVAVMALAGQKSGNQLEAGLLLPASVGLGACLAAFPLGHLMLSWLSNGVQQRTLVRMIQGSSIYLLVLGVVLPIVLLAMTELAKLDWGGVLGAVAGLVAAYAGRGLAHGSPSEDENAPTWTAKLMTPVLTLLMAVSVLILFSFASNALIEWYPEPKPDHFLVFPLGAAAVAFGVLSLLGSLVDSNRISPHYFYRDRLVDAFLKTFARVDRTDQSRRQGRPLKIIRNDGAMPLRKIGENNGSGPYHILVTALNLAGSKELNRKKMKSEHFIFTKEYVGSKITGYVRTEDYREGETKLARAMTISAAAASSAAGHLTSRWWSFLLTLFNVRLGYWMENPWKYRNQTPAVSRWHYWPRWLFYELTGMVDARSKLVNLSDGGHTGDNLGLIPLLDRRCSVIIVCDGEADGKYNFGSFNNACRMAYIEQDIRIDIDLDPLKPDSETGRSAESVATGVITYPDKPPATLIYLKSSMSGQLPTHVIDYSAGHPTFPHESTADQFFADDQFESYRALGHHVGIAAIDRLNPEPST